MTRTLSLIDSEAGQFRARRIELTASRGIYELPLPLVDGTECTFKLEVTASAAGVTVKETLPTHLPEFCPQRHINMGGTFCLYWSDDGPLKIDTPQDAVRWWEMVCKFLSLQVRAAKLRRWPNNDQWAHGSAAKHQMKAIKAANRLGPRFAAALEDLSLSVRLQPKRQTAPSPTLQLLLRSIPVYSVWKHSGKVVNRRQRCFCGTAGGKKPVKLRSCKDHAEAAAELALALDNWRDAEKQFWESWKHERCCGTCDGCPLQAGTTGERT